MERKFDDLRGMLQDISRLTSDMELLHSQSMRIPSDTCDLFLKYIDRLRKMLDKVNLGDKTGRTIGKQTIDV